MGLHNVSACYDINVIVAVVCIRHDNSAGCIAYIALPRLGLAFTFYIHACTDDIIVHTFMFGSFSHIIYAHDIFITFQNLYFHSLSIQYKVICLQNVYKIYF